METEIPITMSAIELKAELKQLIEQQKDMSLLKAIKTLLQKAGLDTTLREKLTSRALKAEKDIKAGRVLSKEEMIRKTNKIIGK